MPDRAFGVAAAPDVEPIPSPEGSDALITSVGADLDVQVLEREIRAEVARKRQEGVYSADLLMAVATDPVADLMFALGDAAEFSVDAPVDSSIPLWGSAVSFVKRVTARFLRWYTKWILGQVHTFATGAVATLNAVEVRMQDHDRRLDDLTRGGGEARNETDQGPSWRLALHSEDLHAVPGRVAVLQCGRGELLARLAQRGIDCYGVESSPDLASACRARGLDVFEQEPRAYLAAAPAGSLGGVVAGIGDGQLNMDVEELVTLAAVALAVDGVLLLGADSRSAALAEALIEASGFKDVQARQISTDPDQSRLVPVPSVGDADLQMVVTALNANLTRIDAALFGSNRMVVLARR
jgi:SAM-dependent methyltransferase